MQDKPHAGRHEAPQMPALPVHGSGPTHISVFLLLALALVAGPGRAQEISAAAQGANEQQTPAPQRPRNAFAENLVPKARSTGVRRSAAYTPIKKQDDQSEIPEIEMFVGESRVFPAPGVARIAVGNGQIMTAAALDGKEVIIFANGIGTSSLFVWNEDGRYQRVKVNIVPGDTTRVAREVAAFLTTIPQAKASIVGDKVIVEGDALSDADLAKIEQLEKRYPQIVNFTNRLGWEPMVLLDVKVVEFPVSELREIGLKWNPAGGAAVGGIWRPGKRGDDGPYQLNIQTGQGNQVPVTSPGDGPEGVRVPASLNVLSAMNMGLNAQLNLLAQDGKAVVLSEPQLAARSGAKASFLAGGEFPYSVATRDGIAVQFKKYGVKLDIEPKVDRTGAVRATVHAEVSKIDPSVSTPSGPALLSRETKTEFNLRSGETMVLAGLIERDNSTNIDKVPLLSDIPVLGALFRSKRFQNRETELVVFVTPRIVDPVSPGQADRIERAHERLSEQLGPKPYLSKPLQPGVDQASSPVEARRLGTSPARDQAKPPGRPDEQMPQPIAGPASITRAEPETPPRPPAAAVLQPGQNPPLSRGGTSGGSALQVSRDGVEVRSAPGHQSDILLRLERGAVVQLGDQATPGDAGSWRHIVVGELQGWVPAGTVAPVHTHREAHTVRNDAPPRPDQQGKPLQLGSGDGVSALAGRPVTADPRVPADGKTRADRPRFRVVLHRLALRVAPDINADVVSHLSAGQKVEKLDQAPKRQWIAIEADGKRGWVSGQWLTPETAQD